MKSNSNQALRTKHFLKKAFIDLVHKKGFSAVTVKDIVEYAQYNRTTFYVYYQNIDDLVEELMEEMFEAIQYNSMSKYESNSRVKVQELTTNSFELLYYIYDHRDYFTLLLLEDTLPRIHQQLPEAIFNLLKEKFDIHYGVSVVDDYSQKRYMAYGTAGLILDWIAQDFDATPGEMTERLNRIFNTFARGFVIKEIDT
ncbi:TetR/AcrR family transcriptional regulator [Lysinibacillus sp. NPDC097279]|uniref:TetR/AcrR family transcriptional regulator n=1 Tax=unclassified Lysinibacillus TaxID=2636778 RepID=UPI00116CA681|nr:TetR/AcrR family transcriptional regulator [Lysinibacillus sp. CD3-6]QPQ34210.1 TetR/AcrR family transcriptional regulator [Lysinibacillus sp. JNUCC-52]UED79836.1 TetR/AcrR family transcriptional regulator [Lysinibacillus sp. CD3-6]